MGKRQGGGSQAIKNVPHNIEAETAVIGAIIFNNDAMLVATEQIKTGEEFYAPAHKIIFAAMLAISAKGMAIDLITLSNHLRKEENLINAGGIDYIASIMEATPTAANVGLHSQIVAEKALTRQVMSAANSVAALAQDDTLAASELLSEAEGRFLALGNTGAVGGWVGMPQNVDEATEWLEQMAERKELITGIRTGFKKLDEKTCGLQNGDLIIVAGRPSMGKTALAMNIAENAAINDGKRVGMVSLEMNRQQLTLRLLSSMTGISTQKMRSGFVGKNELPLLTAAQGRLYDAPLIMNDAPMQSVNDIRSAARRLKAKQGLDLLIIDYLQLIASSPGKRAENRVLEVGAMTRTLKGIARELDIPVVVISQLSRKVEDRPDKRPQLSDLRESGSIEQDADVVAFVYRDEYYHPDKVEAQGKAEVIIAKQRNGPVGRINLQFDNQSTRFNDLFFGANDSPFDNDDEEAF